MSVTIVPTQQPSTWWQRLTGTEPKTVVRETSTTTISSDPGGGFSLRSAIRNAGIGAGVAGALGGVSLLGKVALPLVGKVASVAGLAKLAAIGGTLGLATAAVPLVAPAVRRSPAAKAAVVGAAVGLAAALVLPLMPLPLGAAIGAGVGLLVHHRRTRAHHYPGYPTYPGYEARPGYHPYGITPGAPVPSGLVPVTPNYGMYGGTAMHPYGSMGGYGLPHAGYGMPVGYAAPGLGYGFGSGAGSTMLPMHAAAAPAMAQQALAVPGAQPVVQPAPAVPAAAPASTRPAAAAAPKFPRARTYKDAAGNVRRVGSGQLVRPAGRRVGAVAPGTPAPAGARPIVRTAQPAAAGIGALTSPATYLPGMAGALPFSGGSPFGPGAATGPAEHAGAGPGLTLPGGIAPMAMPARPTA